MEWVKVKFPRARDVFIDGQRAGRTNRKLAVGEGTHAFTLGEPADYKPKRAVRAVTDTSEEFPLVIGFRPADDA